MEAPASRGLTGPTSLVLDDLTSVLRARLAVVRIPLFLMGHSMGGNEVIYYAARGPADVRRRIAGYLAESPWITLHETSQPSQVTVTVARLLAKVMPKQQMVQKLAPQLMSRDEDVCMDFATDELCHDTGTLEGLAGTLARAAELDKGLVFPEDGKGVETCRMWVGHGTEDKVTSFGASQRYMKRLGLKDKEFRVYDGWYHKRELGMDLDKKLKWLTLGKVHAEPGEDKITFANDVADWILARTGATVGQISDEAQVAVSKL